MDDILILAGSFKKLYDPPSSDVDQFRSLLNKANNILAITGAGISPVPTYTGAWGHWRNFADTDLDNRYTFDNMGFLVWEFTHYRREVILQTTPSEAQKALADYERYLEEEGRGRNLTIITLNHDGLHIQAGNTKVIEMFGSLFKTQCLKCGDIRENRKQPIWPSLAGRGDPNFHDYVQGDEDKIPHCTKGGCNGLLRPYIRFEGEDISKDTINAAEDVMRTADLCLVIGTSSTVQPVKEFAPTLAGKGLPVAEFNLINTDFTMYFPFQFKGNCTKTLPLILKTS